MVDARLLWLPMTLRAACQFCRRDLAIIELRPLVTSALNPLAPAALCMKCVPQMLVLVAHERVVTTTDEFPPPDDHPLMKFTRGAYLVANEVWPEEVPPFPG